MKNLLTILLILALTPVYSQEFTYKEKKELKGYPDYIMDSKFSPFRNYFALTIGNNTVEIYDDNWKKIFSHQGNPESVGGHISFSPDEKYLAYAKYKSDNDIAIIRLEDKKVVQVLNGHSYNINKLEFSHNGKYLASASSDETICIWSWKGDQMELFQKFIYEDAVMGISFNYNDEYLIVGGYDRMVSVYKYSNDKYLLSDTIPGLKYWQYDVCFHPSKNEFVSSSQYQLRRYNIINNKVLFQDSLKIRVNRTIRYNSTGEYLVFGKNSDLVIAKISPDEITEFEHIYRHADHVFGGTFSDDGLFLTSFSSDKSSIVWEITGVKPSRKSLITDYMDGELTSAQKMILTAEVIENILGKIDKKLTAPRDEFETTIQYTDRREKLKSEVLSRLQYNTEKHFGVKSGASGKVKIPIERLIGYNADLEIYKIRFMESDAGVKIPIADAKAFKNNWTKAYLQATKTKNKDSNSYEYSSFELVISASKKAFEVTPIENPFHIVKKRRNVSVQADRSESNNAKTEKSVTGEDLLGVDRALIFATNIYDSFSELVNPVIDATTIADELQSNYYVQTELLINPTLKEAIEKIREYAKLEYSANDNLLIFFAGHGIYDDVFKEGYVISRDSKSDDVAKTSYLSHSNLRTMVNNIPCKHILLIMDVCFGGTFDPLIASKSRAADMYTEVTNEEFIQRKKKYKTRLYLTSGGKEYVPDGRPGHHSPFARKLLESLRNYGGNDGILTINEIIQYVEKVEPQPRYGEFGNNEPGSDFILLVK
ncbi:MAG: caspase family protein [Bacteroidales bacterium]|nr:caspase family protein [Bacteroidales bacterium]